MTNILPFRRKKIASASKGKTLCRNNHHKWKVLKNAEFDVKQGKLVTVEKCSRCGQSRTRLT